MAKTSITPGQGGLVFSFPYNPAMVAGLKAQVPPADRRYEPTTHSWIISTQYGGALQDLVKIHLGETVQIPALPAKGGKVLKTIEVRYVGQCKAREDGSVTAFGWAGGNWSIVFPEQTLRDWFEAGPATATMNEATLYSILGAKAASSMDELKTSYRRAALTWHPDRCKDVDAHEMFLKIQHAYQILSDPRKRERYDAGLRLEASIKKNDANQFTAVQPGAYRAPLKSGLLMVEGIETIGRVIVEKILIWDDVVDAQGRVLVTSWPMGAKQPQEVWV